MDRRVQLADVGCGESCVANRVEVAANARAFDTTFIKECACADAEGPAERVPVERQLGGGELEAHRIFDTRLVPVFVSD